jgi:glycosyltransferase involved in cell wall biosynthesis
VSLFLTAESYNIFQNGVFRNRYIAAKLPEPMKTLIVLSKQFPFGNKEQYIAHELRYLSRRFERVIIYPHEHFNSQDLPSFELPDNCEIADLNTKLPRISKVIPTVWFIYLFVLEFFKGKTKSWWLKNVRKFYATWLTQWAMAEGLKSFIRKRAINENEIVYYSYWFSTSAVCLSILKKIGFISGFVCRAHALDLYHEDWKSPDPQIVSLPFRFFKQSQVSLLFPISDHGRNYLAKTIASEKLERRYLGVFDYGINPHSDRTDELVVVSCSGVDERKRIHLIGYALSKLNRRARWIHFGDGPLKNQAMESVTSELVTLEYKGQTNNRDIREFYASKHVDLFVNVSLSEGLPVAIMESMAHGIPAIGVRDYGTSEIVLDGYTGVLLEPNFTVNELVEAFRSFADTPNPQLRVNARKHFEENFNADKNYAAFADRLSTL